MSVRILSASLDGATWRLVHAAGEVDLAAAPELDDVLQVALDGAATSHVVLDLRDVTFMDCAGLRPLLRARRELLGRFWLHRPSAPVIRLLDLTSLTDTFALLDRLPDTDLRALSAQAPNGSPPHPRRAAPVGPNGPRSRSAARIGLSS